MVAATRRPFGEWVREQCKTTGLSYAGLAAMSGNVSRTHLGHIVAGRRMPSPDVAVRLAVALQWDPWMVLSYWNFLADDVIEILSGRSIEQIWAVAPSDEPPPDEPPPATTTAEVATLADMADVALAATDVETVSLEAGSDMAELAPITHADGFFIGRLFDPEWTVRNSAGAVVNLAGRALAFSMRRNLDDAETVLAYTTSDDLLIRNAAGGVVGVTDVGIPGSATADLRPGRYHYTLEYTDVGTPDDSRVLAYGSVELQQAA